MRGDGTIFDGWMRYKGIERMERKGEMVLARITGNIVPRCLKPPLRLYPRLIMVLLFRSLRECIQDNLFGPHNHSFLSKLVNPSCEQRYQCVRTFTNVSLIPRVLDGNLKQGSIRQNGGIDWKLRNILSSLCTHTLSLYILRIPTAPFLRQHAPCCPSLDFCNHRGYAPSLYFILRSISWRPSLTRTSADCHFQIVFLGRILEYFPQLSLLDMDHCGAQLQRVLCPQNNMDTRGIN